MYGLVNRAIQDLVVGAHGATVWDAICERAGAPSRGFEAFATYPDELTYRVVAAACDVLRVAPSDLLRAFGRHWVLYTAKVGFGDVLDLFGGDLRRCVTNLNSMHGRMGALMPQLLPPRFTVEEDGDALIVHYLSTRPGLGSMVEGLLEGLALKFQENVAIEWRPRVDGDASETFVVRYVRP